MTEVKGFIPAAGLGTRLRPMTNHIPKPLFPVMGIPAIAFPLIKLQNAGLKDVAINAHHLAGQIADFAKSSPFSMNIHISHEETLLGSAGCYPALATWRKESDLLVYNADIISTFSVRDFIATSQSLKGLGNMVVGAKPPEGKRANIFMRGDQIIHFGTHDSLADEAGVTAGYGLAIFYFKNAFFKHLPKDQGRTFDLGPVLNQAIAAGKRFSATYFDGYWRDMGDGPRDYYQTHLELSRLIGKNDPAIEAIGMWELARLFKIS